MTKVVVIDDDVFYVPDDEYEDFVSSVERHQAFRGWGGAIALLILLAGVTLCGISYAIAGGAL